MDLSGVPCLRPRGPWPAAKARQGGAASASRETRRPPRFPLPSPGARRPPPTSAPEENPGKLQEFDASRLKLTANQGLARQARDRQVGPQNRADRRLALKGLPQTWHLRPARAAAHLAVRAAFLEGRDATRSEIASGLGISPAAMASNAARVRNSMAWCRRRALSSISRAAFRSVGSIGR
jgi:hypothetical protein